LGGRDGSKKTEKGCCVYPEKRGVSHYFLRQEKASWHGGKGNVRLKGKRIGWEDQGLEGSLRVCGSVTKKKRTVETLSKGLLPFEKAASKEERKR